MTVCPSCQAEIAPAFKACPSCQWLVHGERLKALAASAQADAEEGRLLDALTQWRDALELLPPESRQYEVVQKEAAELSLKLASTPSAQLKPSVKKAVPSNVSGLIGGIGAGVVILLKFKSIFVALFTQVKLLGMGLAQGATLGSMAVSLGLYSTIWNWKFALGVLLGIYVHEMGHVWMMKRFGMKMEAPLFIPGIGAFVQMKQRPLNRVEDARIGMAGPAWGMIFVIGSYAYFHWTGSDPAGRLAHILAWITIFNLIPVWQLDGARAFQGFSPTARTAVLGLTALAWLATKEGLLAFLGIMTVMVLHAGDPAQKTDRPSGLAYAAILLISVWIVHGTPGLH